MIKKIFVANNLKLKNGTYSFELASGWWWNQYESLPVLCEISALSLELFNNE